MLIAVAEGQVQGVGFRHLVSTVARQLGVRGWVANMPDGTVKIVAEAEEAVLESFLVRIQVRGCPADVCSLRTSWSKPTGEFSGFEVRFVE